MNVLFMGSCPFALTVLKTLHEEGGYLFKSVITAPPRPKGRGYKTQKTCVHLYSEEKGFDVLTPSSLKGEEIQATFRGLEPHLILVASYGKILPSVILTLPTYGCVNVHPSLLPRWRGASPVASTLLAGDLETGVSLMVMDEGTDTGALIWQEKISLKGDETTPELSQELALRGARALIKILPSYTRGEIKPSPQPSEGATLAPKLTSEQMQLEWGLPAEVLDQRVRAFFPKAWGTIEGKRVGVLSASVSPWQEEGVLVGEWVGEGAARGLVCPGHKLFRPQQVKPAGGKSMQFEDFLRGQPSERGEN